MHDDMTRLREAVSYINNQWPELSTFSHKIAIVLGSGLSACIDELRGEVSKSIAYKDIPSFPSATVMGHKGELIFTNIANKYALLIMSGRIHLYEGHQPHQVVFPIRVMHLLGFKSLLITNASGAIADEFDTGHFMVISDHINLTGNSPLVGPNVDELGPRFVDMSEAYDKNLITLAKNTASAVDVVMHEGVYMGVLGPSYETPAEIRMFKSLGAHAVGMSTVYEVIAARHMNMRVLGISCLTNKAAGLNKKNLNHQEVLDNNHKLAYKLGVFLKKLVPAI